MADQKITQIQEGSAIVDADLWAVVQNVSTTPVTRAKTGTLVKSWLKTYLDTLYVSLTGWREVSDTWTYASASTITIPSDGTTVYQKWMKIRFKQGGGYKYFIATNVSATLLTVLVNTDHVVANAAITDVAYSFIDNPYGFPHWFAWSPTVTGFSGTPTASGLIRISGGNAEIHMNITGTSSTTTFTCTNLPIAPNCGWDVAYLLGESRDNGAFNSPPGRVVVVNGSTTATFRSTPANGVWTASGTKSAVVFLSFKV